MRPLAEFQDHWVDIINPEKKEKKKRSFFWQKIQNSEFMQIGA